MNRRSGQSVVLAGHRAKRALKKCQTASGAKQGIEPTEPKVTALAIAKTFASSLPVEGQAFGDIVREYERQIGALPKAQLVALKTAYVFASKVPQQEREDVLQELTLALLEAHTPDAKLAYTIARCDWLNWWRSFKTREHYSLNSVMASEDGTEIEFGELLVGEAEFERKQASKMDARSILAKCPVWVREIIQRRLNNERGLGSQMAMVQKWVAANPMILAGVNS